MHMQGRRAIMARPAMHASYGVASPPAAMIMVIMVAVRLAAVVATAPGGGPESEESLKPACPLLPKFNHQLPGPPAGCSDAVRAQWLAHMKACRATALKQIGYSGGVCGTAGVEWTQTAYSVPMVASFDRMLYNRTSR